MSTVIYQVHEKHGKHIAYSAPSAEANRKNGWRDVSEAEFYGRKVKDGAQSSSPISDESVPARRGRKVKDGDGE